MIRRGAFLLPGIVVNAPHMPSRLIPTRTDVRDVPLIRKMQNMRLRKKLIRFRRSY